MKSLLSTFGLVLLIAGLFTASSSIYTIDETEQVLITQFGKPVGEPVTEAGLHFKLPFVQQVNRFEKRVLEWDGPSTPMATKDKVYIVADTFGRWRISDPRQYFELLRDERSAQSRLDDILSSETKNVIAKHALIEAVRTTKDRQPAIDETTSTEIKIGTMPPIRKGRSQLEEEIYRSAAPKVEVLGIELLDLRFKRLNYNERVSETIYGRMISEREQIAERFRAEGAGEAAKILGQKERDLATIESEAYRKVQEIEGEADAKATEIYASAYNTSDQAVALFEFTKAMETYKVALDSTSQLILTTDSTLLQYLKSDQPTSETPVPEGLQGLPSLLNVPSN